MIIREIRENELTDLLELYTHLHEDGVPECTARLQTAWQAVCHHLVVCEVNGRLVSSCVCVIIPNLTRNARPYAVIENVVTHTDHRGRGYATACLAYAKEIARKEGCYKMMLLTSAKDEKTLRFYREAGYNSTDKTAFIQWLE